MKSAYQINSFSFYATAEISTTEWKLIDEKNKLTNDIDLLNKYKNKITSYLSTL